MGTGYLEMVILKMMAFSMVFFNVDGITAMMSLSWVQIRSSEGDSGPRHKKASGCGLVLWLHRRQKENIFFSTVPIRTTLVLMH